LKNSDDISPEQKELMIKLGKKLRELRKEQKKSYEVMAKEIGIPRNTYNLLELGKLNFQFSTLYPILKYYKKHNNLSINDFFKDL
jgi:transcriptional regulator with XRE-family HTH domain